MFLRCLAVAVKPLHPLLVSTALCTAAHYEYCTVVAVSNNSKKDDEQMLRNVGYFNKFLAFRDVFSQISFGGQSLKTTATSPTAGRAFKLGGCSLAPSSGLRAHLLRGASGQGIGFEVWALLENLGTSHESNFENCFKINFNRQKLDRIWCVECRMRPVRRMNVEREPLLIYSLLTRVLTCLLT